GEISHGIDQLITGFGAAVVTEDILSMWVERATGTVLNQWTYHSRLYSAAHYAGTQEDMNLVQLVSFGCGVDAITTDEVRDILEEKEKIYTQIKIDEIANLGAVRIRLRSLLAAIGGERTDE
ncbi:MAG: 2-hydroxyacyl-CoA dehydratase, partial [Peptococcaceae bacterium]|nr:2-hydroxyacyl-CoA dehydratase [Peptococcaceae bacterium]